MTTMHYLLDFGFSIQLMPLYDSTHASLVYIYDYEHRLAHTHSWQLTEQLRKVCTVCYIWLYVVNIFIFIPFIRYISAIVSFFTGPNRNHEGLFGTGFGCIYRYHHFLFF